MSSAYHLGLLSFDDGKAVCVCSERMEQHRAIYHLEMLLVLKLLSYLALFLKVKLLVFSLLQILLPQPNFLRNILEKFLGLSSVWEKDNRQKDIVLNYNWGWQTTLALFTQLARLNPNKTVLWLSKLLEPSKLGGIEM